MIDSAIAGIVEQLGGHLDRALGAPGDTANVVASDAREPNGAVSSDKKGRLNVFLVNVEQETAIKNAPTRVESGQASQRFPPVYLNLYVMIAVDPDQVTDYSQGLMLLSQAVGFFQRQPIFDRRNTPSLDENIERLTMQIENLDMRDLSSLWSIFGGKYRPSVLYKMRIIAFDSDDVRATTPLVLGSETNPEPSL